MAGTAFDYMARMCVFRRDLCREALFLGMMPWLTERSMAGTAALKAASAAALSPESIAFKTLLIAVRTWER